MMLFGCSLLVGRPVFLAEQQLTCEAHCYVVLLGRSTLYYTKQNSALHGRIQMLDQIKGKNKPLPTSLDRATDVAGWSF